MSPELKDRFHGRLDAELHNLYGPTEACIDATWWPCKGSDARKPVPIGRPIANTQVYVLDENRCPVPLGTPGELYIGGAGLARGYLHRPALTAERFVPHPFCPEPGARLLKTGDQVRYRADGTLEFLGRLDHQVKLRGQRVELGEIETTLALHPQVRQAVALLREDRPGDQRLVAYIVPQNASVPRSSDMQSFLRGKLPEHMVPSSYVVLNELPLSPSGKVDRHALPGPLGEPPDPGRVFVPPRTPTEQMLAELWSELLGVERVGVHDHFFQLGGHSLLATRAAVRIRSLLDVQLPLSQLFELPTVALLAARITTLRGTQGEPALRSIPTRDPRFLSQPPMSFAQRRLWFLHQLDADLTAYHIVEAWHLRGPLDRNALRHSLETIVHRHAPLRTTFRVVNDKHVQVIAQPARFDLTAASVRQADELNRRIREEADQPFDLTADVLLRATLLELDGDHHVLLVIVHHIASDAWSQGILRHELQVLYQAYRHGQPAPLAPLSIEYADYAAWQHESWHQASSAPLLDYWRRQLADLPPLELPTDRPRPARFSYRGAEHSFTLSSELVAALRQLGQTHNVTLQMTLLAAYAVLLARSSGGPDFAVGTPIAGRNHLDLENLIGFFVNTLVLRVDLTGEPTFRTLLSRVRAASLAAYDHQDLPFEKLVEELQPQRQPSRSPLVQVLFQLVQLDDTPPQLDGLEVSRLPSLAQRVRFDLELHLCEEAKGLQGVLAYSTDLFDAATIERLAAHFATLLEAIVADPESPINALPMLSAAEREELLLTWNATARPYPAESCVHELFEQQAKRTPDALAVEFGARQLTYRQLNQHANGLAHRLRSMGVGPESVVAVALERSPEMIVALLAILKSGGAYLPLDLEYPMERLAFMMHDTRPDTSSSSPHHRHRLQFAHATPVCLELDGPPLASDKSVNPVPAARSSNLAYVIYTSGSTGKPKGVCVPHRAISRLVRDTNYVQLGPSDRIAHAASVSFDAATFEIWGGLSNGASVIGLGRDLVLSPAPLSEAIRAWNHSHVPDHGAVQPARRPVAGNLRIPALLALRRRGRRSGPGQVGPGPRSTRTSASCLWTDRKHNVFYIF